jgi:mRNA interferase MazF
VLVPFPFTDLSGQKQRPAVVVSPSRFHPDDLVVCAITSQVPPHLSPWEVSLMGSDLEGARLPKPSVVRVGKLFTIHRGLLRGQYGRLRAAKLDEVLGRLRTLFRSLPANLPA